MRRSSCIGLPKTRFVAGFIGRTNFLDGQADATMPSISAASSSRCAPFRRTASLPEHVVVSIRPQSIHLLSERPAAAAHRCCVEGSVQRRAYLGESWDYHVTFAPAAEPLRVTARPSDVFEVGQKIFAEIDTSQMTVVS